MVKNILIIDDEELIVRSLQRLLEKSGYEVFIAKNGQDAIAMAEEEEFNLIISDMRMPGINGAETIQTIFDNLDKRKKPRVPVLFITGYADGEIEDQAKLLKPVDYIYKPFDISQLVNKIRDVIQ